MDRARPRRDCPSGAGPAVQAHVHARGQNRRCTQIRCSCQTQHLGPLQPTHVDVDTLTPFWALGRQMFHLLVPALLVQRQYLPSCYIQQL